MPSCFSLTRKGETSPAMLQDVDLCLCQAFDHPADDERWMWNWYNTIGLLLALGKTFDEIIDMYHEANEWRGVRVAAWLNEHYVSDAWRE